MSFDQSGGDGLVGGFIDQYEGAGRAVRAIGVEGERLRNAHGARTMLFAPIGARRRDRRERADVDQMVGRARAVP